ncbi:MAG: alpha/beta fold hydrolase [Myxococcales bacterium]|nr:alpha/beta fold hydrolase [Myxococcales bacterium]
MPKAASTGRVEVAGAQIYYAIYGQTDGKHEPVILLHGGLGNSDHFAFQVPVLTDAFQVIVIDSRGQGRSTLSKAKLTYHSITEDVIAVMDKLAIKKAAMVGWSDGGEIALDLAIHEPARVSKMFIVGANYDANGQAARWVVVGDVPGVCGQVQGRSRQAVVQAKSFDALIDALLPVWRNPAGFTKAQLKAIQAPSMIALGDHDEIIVLDQVREMAKLIPNGQATVFRTRATS